MTNLADYEYQFKEYTGNYDLVELLEAGLKDGWTLVGFQHKAMMSSIILARPRFRPITHHY